MVECCTLGFSRCTSSFTKLNTSKVTLHLHSIGLAHVAISAILVLNSSIWSPTSQTSEIVVVLAFEFFLQFLLRINEWPLVSVLFFNSSWFIGGLLSRWLDYGSHGSSFLHVLYFLAFLLFFHLNYNLCTCCLSI